MIPVVKDNDKSFSSYISDLLMRSKAQKIVLHSLLSGLLAMDGKQLADDEVGFTQEILRFNDNVGEEDCQEGPQMSDYTQAFQVQKCLNLILLCIPIFDVRLSS